MKKNMIWLLLSFTILLFIGSGCGNGTVNKKDNDTLATEEADITEILIKGISFLENSNDTIKVNRSISGDNSNELNRILDGLSKYDKNHTVVQIAKPMKSKTLKSGFTDAGNSYNKVYGVIYSEKPNSYTKKYKGFFYLKKYKSQFSGKPYDGIILVFEMTYKNGYFDKVDHREFVKIDDLNLDSVLNKPLLIDPVFNKEVSKYNVDFKWRKVSDATEYRFLLSTKKDFSNFSDSYNGGENKCLTKKGCYTYPNNTYKNEKGPLFSNSFRIDKLADTGQTYYWKVRAYNHNTEAASPWSATGVFKTKGGSSGGGSFNKPNFANKGYHKYLNPFDQWASSWYECTRYAFGRAYEQTGRILKFSISSQRHGGKWYDIVKDLPRGITPKANSLVVWTYGTHGHVAYVEDVNGNNITISEANWASPTNGKYNGTKHFTINSIKNRNGYKLKGYVYLK